MGGWVGGRDTVCNTQDTGQARIMTSSTSSSTIDSEIVLSWSAIQAVFGPFVDRVLAQTYPSDLYTPSTWQHFDDAKLVYEWSDTVKINLLESKRGAVHSHS